MFQGTVKFYNEPKGWGFVKPSTGGDDVFVHIHDLSKSGIRQALTEGQQVTYEIADSGPRKPGKQKAVNIKV